MPAAENVAPDHHIMCQMYQIIELVAFTNDCVTQRAAIDSAVGSHFDIGLNYYTAKLGYFYVSLSGAKPKPHCPMRCLN